MTLKERLKELKLHNKEIDACFNDAVAVHALTHLIAKDIEQIISDREFFKNCNGCSCDALDEFRQALKEYIG